MTGYKNWERRGEIKGRRGYMKAHKNEREVVSGQKAERRGKVKLPSQCLARRKY